MAKARSTGRTAKETAIESSVARRKPGRPRKSSNDKENHAAQNLEGDQHTPTMPASTNGPENNSNNPAMALINQSNAQAGRAELLSQRVFGSEPQMSSDGLIPVNGQQADLNTHIANLSQRGPLTSQSPPAIAENQYTGVIDPLLLHPRTVEGQDRPIDTQGLQVRPAPAYQTPVRGRESELDVDQVNHDKDKEIQRLRAELEVARRSIGSTGPNAQDEVFSIPKPKGEAGNRKTGFVLREAMRLEGDPVKEAMYAAIVRTNRQHVIRVGLDTNVSFGRQDPDKLAKVYKLNRNAFSYLTKRRFPADWASAEMVKMYLRNQRKETKRKLKALSSNSGSSIHHIDEVDNDLTDDDEDDAE
ncbi:hypothetical protein H0H92_008273 [Tricholoma furcatifolium]|nr:hypothetical protein H0H92_008273 [Tricholoma furcatifolium]